MIRTPRILVADLHRHVGETVSIAGWAQTLRLQRAVQFVIVRDHTGAVQVTHHRDGGPLEESLDGLSVAKANDATIHLLVTDVVMPGMGGGDLANQLGPLRPGMKFLFVSGYAGKTVLDHKVFDLETNFLQKPYTLKQLSQTIRGALNHAGSAGDHLPSDGVIADSSQTAGSI